MTDIFFSIFFQDDVRDKLTPIQVKFNFKLADDDASDVLNRGKRRKRQAINLGLEPVLDQYTPTIVKAEVYLIMFQIGKTCYY